MRRSYAFQNWFLYDRRRRLKMHRQSKGKDKLPDGFGYEKAIVLSFRRPRKYEDTIIYNRGFYYYEGQLK